MARLEALGIHTPMQNQTPVDAIAIHFWGKQIKADAQWIAEEALTALEQAGYVVTKPAPEPRPPLGLQGMHRDVEGNWWRP